MQTFTLGRFYHQRTVYRKGERRSVIAIIHQTLGDVVLRNAAFFMNLAAFQNHFVSYTALSSPVDNSIGILQRSSQVIGVQDSRLGSLCQPLASHHADIRISNRQDAGTSVRSRRYLIGIIAENLMSGEERNQMSCHTYRAYSRAASTVRAGKGLMQVQVAYIRSDESRVGQSHLRIHIGTVHVHLCPTTVDNVTDFPDTCLENTMSRRIRNHQSRQFFTVTFRLLSQVVDIHVTELITVARQNLISRLNRRSRIGTVSRSRNQNQVTLFLTDAFQVTAYDAQTGIFAGRSGVRLKRNSLESGNHLQLFREILNQFMIALSLLLRYQRMQVHPCRIAEREHFGSRIQFHGTRTQ